MSWESWPEIEDPVIRSFWRIKHQDELEKIDAEFINNVLREGQKIIDEKSRKLTIEKRLKNKEKLKNPQSIYLRKRVH